MNIELPKKKRVFFLNLADYFGIFYDIKSILSRERQLAYTPLIHLADELMAEDKLAPGKQKKIKSDAEKEAASPTEKKEPERENLNISRATGEAFFLLKQKLGFDEETSEFRSSLYGLGPHDAVNYFRERAMCYIREEIKSEVM